MKPPEQVKNELTQNWMLKADEDFRTAEYLSQSEMDFTYPVVFHAQQAVEKYLKALLVWEQIEFPKTHDIAALLALLSDKQNELVSKFKDAAELTPYGVSYRYPGDYPQVEPTEVRNSLEIAERVRQGISAFLRDKLSNESH